MKLRTLISIVALGGACDTVEKPSKDTLADTASDLGEVDEDTVADAADTGPGEDSADVKVDAQSDGESDIESDTASDVAPDPCAPNPCTEVPAARCAEHLEGTSTFTAVCEADGGEAVCTYPGAVEPCEEGSLCVNGACQPFATVCEFPIGERLGAATLRTPGSQSDELDPETGERVDACCDDWDGDGFIDNGFGDTLRTLAPFVGPAADIFGAQLTRAQPVLDIQGLDDLVNDPEVYVYSYEGRTFDPVTESAYISIAGFDRERRLPLAAGAGYIEDGILRVVDGYQRFAFGSPDSPTFVETHQWRVTGRLVSSEVSQGIGLEPLEGQRGATESGLASHVELLVAFNTTALVNCTCTDFADLDEPVIDVAQGACKPAEERAPSCSEPDQMCQLLTGSFCDFIVGAFGPDVDTNGDGRDDAMSVGWWVRYSPMQLVDIDGCPLPD